MILTEIQQMADALDWEEIDYQANIGMISFRRKAGRKYIRINIYITKMTVATCLDHPKKGRTQMFRKHVDDKLMRKIFINPRIHTKCGYQTK